VAVVVCSVGVRGGGEDSDKLQDTTDRDPPKTKLERRPGESVWETMARELASNPDAQRL